MLTPVVHVSGCGRTLPKGTIRPCEADGGDLNVYEDEIEIDIVYNSTELNWQISLGPPCYATHVSLKLKLKLFTTCTACAGLHQTPYAPVAVSGPSQLCHTGNLQVRARPLTA
jgi:hypothetical protein